jgi:Domain of unknown function (DUF4407)
MSAFTSVRQAPGIWPKLRTWRRPGLLWGLAGGEERVLRFCPWERRRLTMLGGLILTTAFISGLSAFTLVSTLRGSYEASPASIGLGVVYAAVVLTVDRSLVFQTASDGNVFAKVILRIGLAVCSALVAATIIVSAIFASSAVDHLDAQFATTRSAQLTAAHSKLNADTAQAAAAVAPQVSSIQGPLSALEAQDTNAENQVVSDEDACKGEIVSGDPAVGRPAGYGPYATFLCGNVATDEAAEAAITAQNKPQIASDEKAVTALEGPERATEASDEAAIKQLTDERKPTEAELGFWTITGTVEQIVPIWWQLGLGGLLFFLDLAPILVIASWGKTDYKKTLERGAASFKRELDEEETREQEEFVAREKARRSMDDDDTSVDFDEPPAEPPVLRVLPPLVTIPQVPIPDESPESPHSGGSVAANPAQGEEDPNPEPSEIVGIDDAQSAAIGVGSLVLEVAQRKLYLGHTLGKGGYFEVRHGTFVTISGDEAARFPLGVAVKRVRSGFEGGEGARWLLDREISFYADAGHLERIPRPVLWERPSAGSDGCLVLEYFPLGTLAQWGTWAPQDLSARIIAAMMLNLVDAESGLWAGHRSQSDIKPHNIGICGRQGDRLFDFSWPYISRAPGALVLMDFNGVAQLGQPPISRSGAYTPPELRLDAPTMGLLSVESDMWAIAATAWTMATRGARPPIGSYEDAYFVPDAKDLNPDCPAILSDLLSQFMHPDPMKRLAIGSSIEPWDIELRATVIRQTIHECYNQLRQASESEAVVWSAGDLRASGTSATEGVTATVALDDIGSGLATSALDEFEADKMDSLTEIDFGIA